jgi:hypothetical protein
LQPQLRRGSPQQKGKSLSRSSRRPRSRWPKQMKL